MSFHFAPADQERPYGFLVCHAANAKTKIRGLLREHRIHPRRACWKDLPTLPDRYGRLRQPSGIALYRVQGDAWLKVRSLGLTKVTWAQLVRLGIGEMSVGEFLG